MSRNATTSTVRSGAGAVGIGGAACAACCAGPILGALSAVGTASAAGYFLAGSVALLIGLAAVVAVIVRRRRRPSACAVPTSSIAAVASPTPGPIGPHARRRHRRSP